MRKVCTYTLHKDIQNIIMVSEHLLCLLSNPCDVNSIVLTVSTVCRYQLMTFYAQREDY